MSHKALRPDSVAVITGGAAGIGLALAERLAGFGMTLVLVDSDAGLLEGAAARVRAAGAREVMTSATDVSDPAALAILEQKVARLHGGTDILINNAAIQPGSAIFGPPEVWTRLMEVNLWGPIHGSRIFAPRMIARGRPGMIINTGSKQGITTPPGDPAYNVAKAGLKAYTEALAHELRNTEGAEISVHLLIPGFVYTGLTRGARTEKPAGAWTPEQLADFALERFEAGDFYVLCPDNDVPRALDEKRMAWAIGDVIENRPPLSRWHPDWAEKFEAYVKGS
jgi:NAD(P)-dependent dehydrogenase (short-subunit alcohol dehydrogenase family)